MKHNMDEATFGPPTQKFRSGDGTSVEEDQVLVGHVVAHRSHRQRLEDYGIYMDLAEFDPVEGRWNRCLFSREVAGMLVDLSKEGQFPYTFEIVPSAGYVALREAEAAGCSLLPVALREWATPASTKAVAEAVTAGCLEDGWPKRSVRRG